jgi:hypothetical protein
LETVEDVNLDSPAVAVPVLALALTLLLSCFKATGDDAELYGTNGV